MSCLSILCRISKYAGLRGFSPLLNEKKSEKMFAPQTGTVSLINSGVQRVGFGNE